MKKLILGVDPGKTGALCLMDENRNVLYNKPFALPIKNSFEAAPVAKQFHEIKEKFGIPHITIIEKVSAMPKNGAVSMFKFGKAAGYVEMAVACMNWPYELVAPSSWTRKLHFGLDKKQQSKIKSLIIATRLFPDYNFLATDRSRVPHDGMVDAALLAEWGRLKYCVGEVDSP